MSDQVTTPVLAWKETDPDDWYQAVVWIDQTHYIRASIQRQLGSRHYRADVSLESSKPGGPGIRDQHISVRAGKTTDEAQGLAEAWAQQIAQRWSNV